MAEAQNSDNKDEKEETLPKNAFQRFKATKTWTVIEILLPILAIVIPTALYFYSVKSGEITINGIQRTSLINTRNEVGQDVTVLYRNVRIASLVSYTLEIANTGNTDIGKEDIYRLRWFPPTNAQILEARVISKTGDYGDFISLDLTDPRSIGFNILALNKGVAARINILCSSDSPTVDDASSRIDGVIRGASIVDNSRNFNAAQQSSFLGNVFAGGLWTNIAKAVIFFLLVAIVLVIVLILIARITNWRDEKKEAVETDRNRELVLSLLRGQIDEDELNTSAKMRWLAESVNFFKALSKKQLELSKLILEKTSSGNWREILWREILLGDVLTQEQRESVRQIPNVDFFLDQILKYRTLHKPEIVIDALTK